MAQPRSLEKEIPSSRRSLILDPVHPSDFLRLNFTFSCEQCSHFAEDTATCTIGYDSRHHLREQQLKVYEQTGRMAFCRFQEID